MDFIRRALIGYVLTVAVIVALALWARVVPSP
jgi:hypothetical protein